ncbi:uncharacterized protein [Paramisgurnus dabryanus]|uniref:uncharacterized protein n=1 Tax=Paramisgurnus dabryanus TaxID=90735 RepID=UPI003CCF8239
MGMKISPYVGPRKYTGELIGVEYLYQQTGKVLQDYRLAIEESETTEVAIEVEEAYDELEEFQDITVPTFDTERIPSAASQASVSAASSSTPPATRPKSSLYVSPTLPVRSPVTSSTSSLSVVPPIPVTSSVSSSLHTQPALSPGAHSSPGNQGSTETDFPSSEENPLHDDCVGPDNIEGYGAVQDLAEHWGSLIKKKTTYSPRHQTNLKQGRFRASKKNVAPGVESTRRCFIGHHSPAQRPDCNRVVEGIFTRLCALYQNAVRVEGQRVDRFAMIARVYRHIRECILTNDRVMRETTIQLPQMNASTISDWFSKRYKSQDVRVTKQGINFPDAPMAGPEKLPAALQKGPTLFPGSLAEPHLFVLPRNTAGEAKLKRRSQPPAISQAPPSHQKLPIIAPAIPVSLPFILPSLQLPTVVDTSSSVPGTSQVVFFNVPLPSAMPPSAQTQTSSQAVPYSTQQYRKRKQMREDTGTVTRKYVRKTDVILCRKCNKERKPPSHLQYFGNWYCKETETQSYAEWRAVLEGRVETPFFALSLSLAVRPPSDPSSALPHRSLARLCVAIGQRVRLLTERLVVRAHPGTLFSDMEGTAASRHCRSR